MHFPYFLFPKIEFEFHTKLGIDDIEKRIYQQTILKETDTHIDLVEHNVTKHYYEFSIWRSFVLFKLQYNKEVQGQIEGNIQTEQVVNLNKIKVKLRSKSWTLILIAGVILFATVVPLFLSLRDPQNWDNKNFIGFIFLIFLIAISRMMISFKIRNQLKIVKEEIESIFI